MKINHTIFHEQGPRKTQQDYWTYAYERDCACYIVADGFGDKGHLASQAFSKIILSLVFDCASSLNLTPAETMQAIINDAHSKLVNTLVDRAAETARTTCAILWCSVKNTIAAHIGDSRIYHFRENNLIWHSSDHSLVNTLSDPARKQSGTHILTASLGVSKEPNPSIHVGDPLSPSDTWLLATDGFWETFNLKQMQQSLRSSQETLNQSFQSDNLIDNATAIFICLST